MIWKINHVVETAQSCRWSTTALIGTGIIEPSFLKTRCNVLSVPTAIWPWICLSDLIRSAHCCSMRRWTLNGYIALIRSTSLTRSYARREYVFDGFAFPLCTKSWRLGRFHAMRKMPVVQDAAHSPTGAASARPAESPAIAGPPTPANDEPAARAMPPAPAIGNEQHMRSTRVRFI
jgi:hypothetical protein